MTLLPLLLSATLVALFFIWILTVEKSRFLYIATFGLCLRLLLIPVIPEITTADINDYRPYFQAFSNSLSQSGFVSTMLSYPDVHVEFYTILLPGYIYHVLGDNGFIVIRSMNAVVGVSVVYLLNGINEMLFNRPLKRWQAGLIILWPSYVFFSVTVGRMAVSILFVVMAVYYLLRVIYVRNLTEFAAWLGSSALMSITRTYYVLYSLVPLVLVYIWKYMNESKQRRAIAPVPVSIAIVLSYVTFQWLIPYDVSIEVLRQIEASGTSAYLRDIYPGSLLDLLWYMPIQGIYFQFSPFIWDVFAYFGALPAVAAMQSTVLLASLIVALPAINNHREGWTVILILMSVMGVSFLLGAGVKNAGSAMRWRLPTELILLSLTSTMIDHRYLQDDES